MGVLLAILGVLFLTLLILVPLLEKYGRKGQPQDYRHLTRFIFPLMTVLILLQLFRYYLA